MNEVERPRYIIDGIEYIEDPTFINDKYNYQSGDVIISKHLSTRRNIYQINRCDCIGCHLCNPIHYNLKLLQKMTDNPRNGTDCPRYKYSYCFSSEFFGKLLIPVYNDIILF